MISFIVPIFILGIYVHQSMLHPNLQLIVDTPIVTSHVSSIFRCSETIISEVLSKVISDALFPYVLCETIKNFFKHLIILWLESFRWE